MPSLQRPVPDPSLPLLPLPSLQAELAMEQQNKKQGADRNKALLDSLQALTKRNSELETRIMEMNRRDLERLKEIEAMSSDRDEEVGRFARAPLSAFWPRLIAPPPPVFR